MSSSFLAVGDEHLERMMLNESELKQDIYDYYENAVNKAIELKVKYFISCGDLFDTNKPQAHSIEFVSSLNKKLRENGVVPLALSGDHSKNIENICWEDICGFEPIYNESNFAGVDYDDNPANVKKELETQLINRADVVEFVFLHGQVPELFGFVEEKKKLDLDWEGLVKKYPTIKGFILGDIHNGCFKYLTGGQFLGYTGALGVTRLDEVIPKRYLHYDGEKLNFISYPLIRIFHEFNLTEETLKTIESNRQAFMDHEIKEIEESTTKTGRKPVYILRYHKVLFSKLTELAFLYDHAIVRTTILPEDEKVEINVNIRSEISDTASHSEVFKATLVESSTFNEELYRLGVKLLDSLVTNNTKDILNEVKKEYI